MKNEVVWLKLALEWSGGREKCLKVKRRKVLGSSITRKSWRRRPIDPNDVYSLSKVLVPKTPFPNKVSSQKLTFPYKRCDKTTRKSFLCEKIFVMNEKWASNCQNFLFPGSTAKNWIDWNRHTQRHEPVDNDWASTLIVGWETEKKMKILAVKAFPSH